MSAATRTAGRAKGIDFYDGVLDIDPWWGFMRTPNEEFKAQVWDEYFTREELRELLDLVRERKAADPENWQDAFTVPTEGEGGGGGEEEEEGESDSD